MHRNESANMTSDNLFPSQPPLAVITPELMNAIQEEIMNVVTQAGLPVLGESNDTKDQLYTAIRNMALRYDYIVDSQTSFVNLFTRTGANSYDINADYNSVYFKYIEGGYGFVNVLSGGDTWGDILTKNCKHLEFESGAYINFANMKGNITVETADCYLKNVEIKGAGSVAAGIIESFKLNAFRVTYDNCKCNTRLSNVDMVGFQGSAAALHNITSKYVNCSAFALDGSDRIYGFKDCSNISNSIASDLDSSTGISNAIGFSICDQISNCYAYQIDSGSGDAAGFYGCDQTLGCNAEDIDSGSGDAYGFYSCNQISSCNAEDIDSASGNAYGFYSCNQISSCNAEDIDSASGNAYGFHTCTQISGCYAYDIDSVSSTGCGFYGCNQISSCYANDIDSASGAAAVYGFTSCDQISSCYANDIDSDSGIASGFNNCRRMSSCTASDIDSVSGVASGFNTCVYGAALYTAEATNPSSDWIDTVDAQITNKVSTPSVWT